MLCQGRVGEGLGQSGGSPGGFKIQYVFNFFKEVVVVVEAMANVEVQVIVPTGPQFAVSGVTVKNQVHLMGTPMPGNVEAQGIAQAGHLFAVNGDIVKSQVVAEDQGVG